MLSNGNELKVLVVEDSKVTMRALCSYLERMGIHNLLTAETGQAALEMFRNDRPDIVLLDAILPDIDGFDIAKQMRALEQGQDWSAIIFLTSMSKDDDLARGIEVGGDDYLMKPISEVVLKAKVRAMRRLVEMQRALVDVTRQLNGANKELQRLSTTDGLTGIANRRLFDELLQREWRRCTRARKQLSLVMVDIDYFKQYNDNYGHQLGDVCLKAVAGQVARSALRPGDLAARYGGEEFVLVLSETDMDGAKWVANHIRQHVAELKIKHATSPAHFVTVSCGVSTVTPNDQLSMEVLLKSADHALYAAKMQGRDQVVCADYGQARADTASYI
ncbi:MAG: diguanylate cyclase [Sideroxydans sp.]|nr:diguanylate cyclase [Sideroxydans sp.]